MIKLPKDLQDDPRHAAVTALLEADTAPLWEKGRTEVATVPLSRSLAQVLGHALHVGLASQGLELVTEKLASEQLGLDAMAQKTPTAPSEGRVSRLLVLANDGSTRFYRNCDALISRYERRLLACRVDLDGNALGQALFGRPKLVRCVLVHDKHVVSRALLAMLEP